MITKEMKIAEVMQRFPQTIAVFTAAGLDCQDCQIAELEDIQHGAAVHNVDIEALTAALNQAIADQL